MKNVYTTLGFAFGASAATLTARDQCCFSLTAAGGKSGAVGELSDGQTRIGQTAGLDIGNANFCLSNGGITDGNGRGCILTPPTTQFQCDVGAAPTTGFAISSSGDLTYNGNTQFYACATGDNGGYNIYTTTSSAQTGCVKITLNTGGKCAGSNGSGSSSAPASSPASSKPASSVPASAPSVPASKPASSAPSAPVSAPSAPASAPSVPASKPASSAPSAPASAPSVPASKPASSAPSAPVSAPSAPASAPSVPASKPVSPPAGNTVTVYQPTTVYVTNCAAACTPVGPASQPAGSKPASAPNAPASASSVPASAPSAPAPSAPSAPASAPSAPASSAPSAPASVPSAPASQSAGSKSAPAPSGTQTGGNGGNGGACQTTLTGAYQTPHAIIPVNKDQPSTSYGTQYFAYLSSSNSTVFNFDVPASYSGKQCSVIFLLPNKNDLQTSDFTMTGSGGIKFDQLTSPAPLSVSYASCPAVKSNLNTIDDVTPGNSYVVSSGACAAGQTVSILASSTGGLDLSVSFSHVLIHVLTLINGRK
ncbi:unnamed protein product [Aureobasidium vineae]|uniref:Ubiquitin 3 binding protein But2 C-terminal domain-containing protein n=1 Tax=Aureobasidium vineae TaxID=2773715 RepID=A0A9N8PI13_9PEZI|nr:unnamed protein product [Aureobasidium vineae]